MISKIVSLKRILSSVHLWVLISGLTLTACSKSDQASVQALVGNITASLPTATPTATATPSSSVAPASSSSALIFKTQPSTTALAGAALVTQPIINVVDSNGNVTANSDTVTIALYSDSTCTTPAGGLSGTVAIAASTGVVTYAGLYITASGTFFLKATSGSLTSACSSTPGIAVAAGVPDHLGFAGSLPTSGSAGTNLSPQPVVTIYDQYNNVLNASSAITLSLYTDSTCSTSNAGISGNSTPVNASSGVATFSGIKITKAGTVYLGASGGGLNKCSPAIGVAAGTYSSIMSTLASAASTIVSGATSLITFQSRDLYGNPTSTGLTSVSFNVLAGTGTGSIVAGTNLGGGTYISTLTGAHAGTVTPRVLVNATDGISTPSAVTITPSGSTYLVISGFPNSVIAGTTHGFTVTAYDGAGNVATGYTGTVQFTGNDGAGSYTSNYGFQAGDNGSHTFASAGGIILNTVASGTASITVTDISSSSITGTQTGISVLAAGTLTYNSFTIPGTVVGGNSSTTVTVTNSGQTNVTITTAPTLTTGSQYSITATTCTLSTVISAGGGTCTITLRFSPTAPAGSKSDQLNIGFNNTIGTYTASDSFSGTANTPASLALSASGPFADTPLGATSAVVTYTLTNSGQTAATLAASSQVVLASTSNYTITTTTCTASSSLAANGGTCTISVTFNPTTATGALTTNLTATYNNGVSSGQTAVSALTANSISVAVLTITPVSTVTLPSTAVGGTSTATTFTATNSGGSTATINTRSLTGTNNTDYFISGGTCSTSATVAAGSTCTILVQFTPTASGTRTATLNLNYNNGATSSVNATTVALTGTATTVGALTLTGSGAFSNAVYDASSTAYATFVTITLQNSGGTAISSLQEGTTPTQMAAPFSWKGGTFPGTGGSCTSSLAVSATCTVVLAFTPTSNGSFSSTVRFAFNNGATTTSSSLALSGTGVAAALLTYSPTSYDFGAVNVFASAQNTFTITNSGGYPATSVSVGSFTAPYSQFSTTCGATIAVAGTCTVVVTYSPTTGSSADNSSVSIGYNDGKQSQTATASITGHAQFINTFAYQMISTYGGNKVIAYSADPSTGVLSNFKTYSNGISMQGYSGTFMVPHPSGRLLYNIVPAKNWANQPGYGYAVDPAAGTLSNVWSNGTLDSDYSYDAAWDPQGVYLFRMFNTGSGNTIGLKIYTVNLTTGALTLVTTSSTTANCGTGAGLSVHPSGKFVYLNCQGSGLGLGGSTLYYKINRDTGAITSSGAYAQNASAYAARSYGRFTFHPNGLFAYYTGNSSSNMELYSLDQSTGAPTFVSNAAFPASADYSNDRDYNVTPQLHPNGKFLYARMANGSGVARWAVDPATGALSSGTTLTLGASRGDLRKISADGRFAYVVNTATSGSPTMDVYTINASTGALTYSTTSALTNNSWYAFTWLNTGSRFMYYPMGSSTTIASNTTSIVGMAINQSNGSLSTAQTYTTAPTGSSAMNQVSAIVHPNQQYLYTVDYGVSPYGVAQYSIDKSNGNLTSSGASVAPTTYMSTGLNKLRMHPSGLFLYGLSTVDHKIETFLIDQVTGAVAESNALSVDSGASEFNIEPRGRYLFVNAAGTVKGYSINQGSGALTYYATLGAPADSNVGGYDTLTLSIDPSSSVLYAGTTAGNVCSIPISLVDGSFGTNTCSATYSTHSPAVGGSTAIHPNGTYFYTGMNSSGQLDYSTTNLGTPSTTGTGAVGSSMVGYNVGFESSGNYCYEVGASGIYPFTINQSTFVPSAGTLLPLVNGNIPNANLIFVK